MHLLYAMPCVWRSRSFFSVVHMTAVHYYNSKTAAGGRTFLSHITAKPAYSRRIAGVELPDTWCSLDSTGAMPR